MILSALQLVAGAVGSEVREFFCVAWTPHDLSKVKWGRWLSTMQGGGGMRGRGALAGRSPLPFNNDSSLTGVARGCTPRASRTIPHADAPPPLPPPLSFAGVRQRVERQEQGRDEPLHPRGGRVPHHRGLRWGAQAGPYEWDAGRGQPQPSQQDGEWPPLLLRVPDTIRDGRHPCAMPMAEAPPGWLERASVFMCAHCHHKLTTSRSVLSSFIGLATVLRLTC